MQIRKSITQSRIRASYHINEAYLLVRGFRKICDNAEENICIYRYYNPGSDSNGIDLTFLREFNILSVDEFWVNSSNGQTSFAHSVVGKFRIASDDDLDFIFSRSVRLDFIFNTLKKRI